MSENTHTVRTGVAVAATATTPSLTNVDSGCHAVPSMASQVSKPTTCMPR